VIYPRHPGRVWDIRTHTCWSVPPSWRFSNLVILRTLPSYQDGKGFFSACSWLALVAGVGGYVLAGVEIGVCLVYFSIFAGVRVVGVCVLVYARTHTQTTWVLDVSPGAGRTPGEPDEPRSTKAQYTCRPNRRTKYICLYICWAAGFDDLG